MEYRVYMGYKKKDHFNFHISLFSIAILVFLGILIGWVSFWSFYRNKHIFLASTTNILNLRLSSECRFEGKVKSLNKN